MSFNGKKIFKFKADNKNVNFPNQICFGSKFSLIKQVVFIALFRFSSCLAPVADQTKFISLNDEPCKVRPTFIDLNSTKLKYYPFLISLDKCNWRYNTLSSKIFFQKKKKSVNVKVFDVIANKNQTKTMTKHVSCDCKCKFNSIASISDQKWNNKTCQCECKNYGTCKNGYS